MQEEKQQLEPDTKQQTGSKLGKEYIKAVYCHPAYLTYMQSTSCDMPDWMTHKLDSRLPGDINNLRYVDDTTLMTESKEELKSLLMKVKEESKKASLKLNILKTKIMAAGPITSWQIDWEKVEKVETVRLFSWAPKSLQMLTAAMKLRHLLLKGNALTNLDTILKQRHYFSNKGLSSQSYGFSSSHILMLGHKEG